MARLGAILLAAGASRRFGRGNKLVADIGGKPLIRLVAEETASAGIADLVVVTGCDRRSVESVLQGLPLRFAHNPNWEEGGLGSSISAGTHGLAAEIEGAFIVPGDMPFLTAQLLKNLADIFEQTKGGLIVFPATPSGEQRNPVLWPRWFFPELASLNGANGAKPLLARFAGCSRAMPFDEERVFADIDDQRDLTNARHIFRRPKR